MEHLQDQHLNEPHSNWTPWQADEELLAGIMSGELVPPVNPEEAQSVVFDFYFPIAA